MLNSGSGMNSLLPGLGSMRREMQRALEDVGGNGLRTVSRCPITMWQDEGSVYVHADVPGLTREDLDLQFEDGKLWIRGERQWFGDDGFVHNERSFGKFERAILLSDVIDPSSIDARLEDGVLIIQLMKKPEAQPRKISIRHEGSKKNLSDDSSGE